MTDFSNPLAKYRVFIPSMNETISFEHGDKASDMYEYLKKNAMNPYSKFYGRMVQLYVGSVLITEYKGE